MYVYTVYVLYALEITFKKFTIWKRAYSMYLVRVPDYPWFRTTQRRNQTTGVSKTPLERY